MRNRLVEGALCATLMTVAGAWAVAAQQHQHPPAAEGAQKPEPAPKKDPNRKKPENQPGKVVNAEALAASHADHHEMETFPGGGVLPEGWKHRFDLPTMKLEHVLFHAGAGTLHVRTGPPGIFYNPDMAARGEYSVGATFTQVAKGEHREGYGVFIGGADLEGAGQRYTYFLLRQDGKFLIKQRIGVNTKGVVDWTAHPAVAPFGTDDKMTNKLRVLVGSDAVRFLINGVEVARHPKDEVETQGIFGLRINHQLNVEIEGLEMTAAEGSAPDRD